MLRIVNGTEINKKISGTGENKFERKVLIMKNHLRTMVENYFVKNLVALGNVGKKENSVEVLRRNSYTMLNVSPRFF